MHRVPLVTSKKCKRNCSFLVVARCSRAFYRPQRSCGQGNIFTQVCHSVHRGGGSASVHAGIPPPRKHNPLEQTHAPPEQTSPSSRPPRSKRSTSGWYASYFLLECILVNIAINDIHAKKFVCYSPVLVVPELVVSGTQIISCCCLFVKKYRGLDAFATNVKATLKFIP